MEPLTQRGRDWKRVVVLTGAGISAAAGLPTYRGEGGLWTRDPQLAASLRAGADPDTVWKSIGAMRPAVAAAAPTAAHAAIRAFEVLLDARGGTLTVLTQNVDGLHSRAGSSKVIEVHGSLLRTRCSNQACSLVPFDDSQLHERAPTCPECGAKLRPTIVLFDEPLGAAEEVGAKRSLRDCDLFIAIGTSGTVWPASSYVRSAAYEGAHTVFLNATPLEPPNPAFHEIHLGDAQELTPALLR